MNTETPASARAGQGQGLVGFVDGFVRLESVG